MRLCEHPDFDQAILRAEEHFRGRGLRPAIIEKDYYVTEALRIIAKTIGDRIIFKGGTSLSKGWNLIERFSEDIDLFLDPLAFEPSLGKQGIDRELKRLRDAIGKHPALRFVREESRTIGGFGRSDRFAYEQRFGGPGGVASRVLLESGTASGREPTAGMPIRSYLAEFLQATGQTLGHRGRAAVHDAAPPLPAHVRREALRHSRQGRAVQARRPPHGRVRPPPLRPVSTWLDSRKWSPCSGPTSAMLDPAEKRG